MTDTYELFQKGRTQLRSGMTAQATVSLEKAKRREPRSRSIREALGIAYFRLGRWEEAEAELRALVELSPADAERLELKAGDTVQVAQNGSSVHAKVIIRERLSEGVCFLIEGTAEANANALLNGAPVSVEIQKVES